MGFALRERGVRFAPLKPADFVRILAIAGIVAIPLLIGAYAQSP